MWLQRPKVTFPGLKNLTINHLLDTTISTITSKLVFSLMKLLMLWRCLSALSYTVYIDVSSSLCFKGVESRLSGRLELCADMSLKINQAYQSDRCLSTCYKHLPHLAPAPSLHRLFIMLQPP